MPRRPLPFAAALTLVLTAASLPGAAHAGEPATQAVAAATSDPTVAGLRSLGQVGLDKLLRQHAGTVDALRSGNLDARDPNVRRLAAMIDAVAGQKDAAFSGLFWHDNLASARDEATRTGRPILSLHLLGKLTDEKSCANSRFFRTVLYPDPEVSTYLRDHFILHWHSVRPVPTLSVDLGDGRKIQRTITGNSVHYVLDAQGRVLDGVPGLVSADAFLASLRESVALHETLTPQAEAAHNTASWSAVTGHWAPAAPVASGKTPERSDRAQTAMALATSKQFVEASSLDAVLLSSPEPVALPPAIAAMQLSFGKGAIEMPAFSAGLLPIASDLEPTTTAAQDTALLSAPSQALMRHQHPHLSDEAFTALLDQFRTNLATDTARNLSDLQPRLRRWLAQAPGPAELQPFNQRVYKELFHTPLDDLWMGLDTPGVYTGLTNGGLVLPADTTPATPQAQPHSNATRPGDEQASPPLTDWFMLGC